MADPPPLWLRDISNNAIDRPGPQAGLGGLRFYSNEALSEAYRHLRQVGEARRDCDLYDLLASVRREETYQPYFQGVSSAGWGAVGTLEQPKCQVP